jgi:hypothetical protein
MNKQDAASAVMHATPPVGAVGVVIFGLSIPEWAAIVGIVVLLIQGIYWGVKTYKELK